MWGGLPFHFKNTQIMHSENKHMTAPCRDCPFRKDCNSGWLGKERATEICEEESFVCHKTTDGDLNDRKQCAGHMTLTGPQNLYVRFAKMLQVELNLRNRHLIFDSKSAMIDHHSRS